jgi:Fur family zinc uptake transcriptional regulator
MKDRSLSHLGCGPAQLAEALREAEDLCRKRGGALTPLRKMVLTFLLEADRPIKAYDMLQKLRDDRSANPPTIYRTLGFDRDRLAHWIESSTHMWQWALGSYTAVFLLCEGWFW